VRPCCARPPTSSESAPPCPPGEEWYACPLCLIAYPRAAGAAGVLTEEHVPPHALGGYGLLLTCAACNSTAGTALDAHAVRRQRLEDFFTHRQATAGTLPATVYAGGIPLRGTVQWTTDGSLQIFGVPQQNHPDQQAAHRQTLDGYVDRADPNPDLALTIHIRQYDANRDQLSWIRAAYLAAFAALGWRYILHPVMHPYRIQFREPATATVPVRVWRDRTAAPDQRRILLVEQPNDLRGVAVTFGNQAPADPTRPAARRSSATASLGWLNSSRLDPSPTSDHPGSTRRPDRMRAAVLASTFTQVKGAFAVRR
jgi:hypothetical protein